jgi:3,4-dihydroxy 2-butanone 4-phosphate synthase/GTP cyclohydrolase II
MDKSVTSNAAAKSGSLSNAAVTEISEALRRTPRRQFAADGFEDVEILDVSAGLDPTQESPLFTSIREALAELQAGRMIVIVDDEDRENEGDLMIAAEMITPEAINFMATRARGLICMAITSERADALELSPMVLRNTSWGGTPFTVSVDAKGRGVTTGISAYDRAQTVLAIVNAHTRPEDLARPGHIFPLRARRNGVLERRGHTEAAVDLARLAGLDPSGVICEIANDDGAMACLPDLIRLCSKYALKIVSVADLALYRSEFARRAGDASAARFVG